MKQNNGSAGEKKRGNGGGTEATSALDPLSIGPAWQCAGVSDCAVVCCSVGL